MSDFYTILTTIGKSKLANAQATGTTVNLTELAVGDGNGAYYSPSEDQTALVNEVWRGSINQIYVDSQNSNWVVIEAVIPTDQGGFYVREVGVFDDAGDMIAIGKYPETYKPALDSGSGKDLYIRMILEISNVSDVTLKIDPAIVLATRKYVDDELSAHTSDTNNPHGVTASQVPITDVGGYFTATDVENALQEIGDFTALKETTGYQKLPNGLIIQWGHTSTYLHFETGVTSDTITFPIAFPTACLAINTTVDSITQALSAGVVPRSVTATHFTMYFQNNRTDQGVSGRWIAIGY